MSCCESLLLRIRAMACVTVVLTLHGVGIAQMGWHVSRTPTGQIPFAMTYDVLRQRTVLVAGTPMIPYDYQLSTWEWDGMRWHRHADFPRIAQAGHLVYDTSRRRCLYVEFPRPFAPLVLWEWDGSQWSVRPDPNPPPVFGSGHVSYDVARSRLVLFGGMDRQTKPLTDTWEWDGRIWTLRTPSRRPPSSALIALSYDVRRGRTVLFHASPPNQTWEWDGSNWYDMAPANRPPDQFHFPSLAYDLKRGRTVLTGQADTSMWEWDGSTWHSIQAVPLPDTRYFPRTTSDLARSEVLLYGGTNDTRIWGWDGKVWRDRSPREELPGLTGQRLTYLPSTSGIVAFGGETSSELLDRTYTWDGREWHEQAPANRPAPRSFHAMATDTARGRIVLFGGYGANGVLNDTWEWDGTDWYRRTPAGSIPPARREHAMAFDAARKRVVLYGGVDSYPSSSSVYFGDTWEWDGQAWTRVSPASRPGLRRGHAMAYDEQRQRVVFFGGVEIGNTDHRTTWEFDGVDWRQVASSGPSARFGGAMAYDSTRKRVQLFAGRLWAAYELNDLWEWDGQVWSQLDAAPVRMTDHGLAYDPKLRRLVASGRQTLWYGDHVNTVSASIGYGCSGSALGPVLQCDQPWIGNGSFGLGIHDAIANAACAFGFAAGWRIFNIGNGCVLYLTDPIFPIGGTTNRDGIAVLPLPLPYDGALRGITLYAQGFVVDPQGPALGLTFTAGRRLVIGD